MFHLPRWVTVAFLLFTAGACAQEPRPSTNSMPPPRSTSSADKKPQTERQFRAISEAKLLSSKADAYEKQGKQAEAERAAERALALQEQARGPWHLEVAHSLDQVADLYSAHKKDSEAQRLYDRARAIREKALSEHPDIYERDAGELRPKKNQPVNKNK